MSKMSKTTLEFKLEEVKMFNKILLEENKKLKSKIKELEKLSINKNKKLGRKAYNNEEVIKDMFSLYLQGLSMKDIADRLNSTEIKTVRGGEWSKSSISWIMRKEDNINIVGKETYNKVIENIKNNRLKLKK